jgi:regulator of protease activity HflC (stomatin/prohibitin superfamily)
MDDSDKDAPEASGSAGRPQMPIGGIYRDPREVKTNPTLTKFLRERMTAGIIGSLVAIGVLRPRTPSGELGRRSWRGLAAFLGSIFAIVFVWTSVHIVQPGSVAVPVTFGHSGKPLSAGFHITLPFTTAYSINTRTQNYTMTSNPGEGQKGNTDDSVAVLGRDGGAASVNATVLYRVDPTKATSVFRNLGTNYASAIVRPQARTCIRDIFTKYDMVSAATSDWNGVETGVSLCMNAKLKPEGLMLQDFQLREVTLSAPLASAVAAKVAAQQVEQQQVFELATAQQQADITRIQALATADSQQILACGGSPATLTREGQEVQTVIPNPLTRCSQAQLTPAYLQFTYIQALKQLATSNNTTTLVLPFDKNLTPLITLPSGSPTGSSSTATTVPGSSSSTVVTGGSGP